MLDFMSLVSVSFTKSEVLIKKVKEIMMNRGTDITKIDITMEPTRWVARKVVFREAIEMMHLFQYMSTVDATGVVYKVGVLEQFAHWDMFWPGGIRIF